MIEIKNKGLITLYYDKYEDEYMLADNINEHYYWFKSYKKAWAEYERLTNGK